VLALLTSMAHLPSASTMELGRLRRQLQLIDPQLVIGVRHPIEIGNGQVKRLRIQLQKLGQQRPLAKCSRVAISIIFAGTPGVQLHRRHQAYSSEDQSQQRLHTAHLFEEMTRVGQSIARPCGGVKRRANQRAVGQSRPQPRWMPAASSLAIPPAAGHRPRRRP
jgi:hypothetical protein